MLKYLILLFVTYTIFEKINAQYWSALGNGIGPLPTSNYCEGGCTGTDGPYTGPPVASMCMYKGEIYAAGFFDMLLDTNAQVNNIAKWNGATWSVVGNGVSTVDGAGGFYDTWILALSVYKDELYAAGRFTHAGNTVVNNIAKWNGTSWSAVGQGLGAYGSTVSSLAIYNGELYAGGYFSHAGGLATQNIAKWNGVSWTPVGTGIEITYDPFSIRSVNALMVHNDTLYAGGSFDKAGAIAEKNIAKWDGQSWSAAGIGISEPVSALASYNGLLVAASGFNNIRKFNGVNWPVLSTVGGGAIFSLTTYNGHLIAGGYFDTIDVTPANNIAKWNGTNWSPVGKGIGSGVTSLAVISNALYAGGSFHGAGDVFANRIAAWNEQCSAVPEQPGQIKLQTSPCQNSYAVFSIGPVTNAADFTWTLPSGWSGNSVTNSISVIAGSAKGTISVKANNPCGSSIAQTIQVEPPGTAIQKLDSIMGENVVNKHSYQDYAVTPMPNAISYAWTLPSGWQGNSNTHTIKTHVGENGGTISVKAVTGCGESNRSDLFVTVRDSVASTVINNSVDDSFYIRLFPNPTSGRFSVGANNMQAKQISIEVLNVTGRVVNRSSGYSSLTDYIHLMDITSLPDGVYLLKIVIDNNDYTRKIVKNR